MPRLVAKNILPFFTKNGVPASVLHTNFALDWQSFITPISFEANNRHITVSVRKQQTSLNKILEMKSPYFSVIAGETNDNIAAQVALLLCLSCTKANKPFYWHLVTGSTHDLLRDDNSFRLDKENISLLILSGIAANSTNMKIEKLRDLLYLYSHIPRVVVLAGANPLEYCFKSLYIKPNYVSNFGKG